MTDKPQYSQKPPHKQKSVDLPKPEKTPKPQKPPKPEKTPCPKPVTPKKVVSREDDQRQKQATPSSSVAPLLSLHRKDVENKGMTIKKQTEMVEERRRSSWEFFLETKKLKKLKKKKQKKEEKMKKKYDWKKKTTVKRVGRKSVKRFFAGLKNAFGLGNKKRETKKVKQNRDIYPLDEFSSRSSKPFRMDVQ